ncbi:uncharacterized protein G2W53_032284 [Senna tora]|uniref:Uncharacterized protein n=1 Tax=Senna tora TaxID=362788 RepID=A0A834W7K6_9FABA|nr:uncharacterized protein G2W53_032284 [Senna tora]
MALPSLRLSIQSVFHSSISESHYISSSASATTTPPHRFAFWVTPTVVFLPLPIGIDNDSYMIGMYLRMLKFYSRLDRFYLKANYLSEKMGL